MTAQLTDHRSRDLVEIIRLERIAFAAKIRLARGVLGWSQSEFGFRVGLTQRAIHKLEQGDTDPRRTTVRAIEAIWRDETSKTGEKSVISERHHAVAGSHSCCGCPHCQSKVMALYRRGYRQLVLHHDRAHLQAIQDRYAVGPRQYQGLGA